MSGAYLPLAELVRFYSEHTKMHICIHDISGILGLPDMEIPFENTIHSRRFCSVAKSTDEGYKTCIGCKTASNDRAVTTGELFVTWCPYGLYKVVKPVIIGEKVQCILYLGNLITDREQAESMIHAACIQTKVSERKLKQLLEDAQEIKDATYYERLICFLDSYIRLLYEQVKDYRSAPASYHWAVDNLKRYIQVHYANDISLKNAAKLYYIHEKYLGTLFKRQTGETVHQYLTRIRLEKAREMLGYTTKSVTDIAIDCGFESVSYFSRLFRNRYGVTPGQYRKGLLS